MAGRPGIGSRFVILVAVASTLLATWVPPGRVCACAATPATAVQGDTPATAALPGSCPCCRHLPTGDDAHRACCGADEPADAELGTVACDCSTPPPPDSVPPATPPRPADSDEAGNPPTTEFAAAFGYARPPITTPAVEAARGRAGPPPVDLIISLLRITC